ncbi:hypothetical protein ACIXWW_02980 [Bacteroides fragilis]
MNKKASIQPKTEKSNSKKRDYRLIVDGKYNFRAIIKELGSMFAITAILLSLLLKQLG